jgi:hypothetical protein
VQYAEAVIWHVRNALCVVKETFDDKVVTGQTSKVMRHLLELIRGLSDLISETLELQEVVVLLVITRGYGRVAESKDRWVVGGREIESGFEVQAMA